MDIMDDALTITYEVPSDPGLAHRAEQIAVGMTVGSWTDLPATQQERLARHLGRVVSLEDQGTGSARLTIQYPAINLRPTLSSALTVGFGKVSWDGRIRLVGLTLPTSWRLTLPGPRHGIEGLRSRLNVPDRPLLMSIFKSENGRNLGEFRQALREQWLGGADLVKDDEIFFADQDAPARERIAAAHAVADEVFSATGRRPLYALNLTASGPELPHQAEALIQEGAEAFLVSPFTVGLDALTATARLPGAPILLAHPAFAGAFSGAPGHGVAPEVALGTLLRAAGADIVIYPSPYGSVSMARADALAVHAALTQSGPRRAAASAPSAGIHPGLIPTLVQDFGRDVIINAGGAIHGHPQGTLAGARAFRQAIDRIGRTERAAGSDASSDPIPTELAQALQRWGGVA